MATQPATATASTADPFKESVVSTMVDVQSGAGREIGSAPERPIMETSGLNIFYGDFHAVHDVNLVFGRHEITALIGPSGCGKSTVLRSLNRMNDLVPGARVEGRVSYHGQNIYDRGVDPIAVRTNIGMVFQNPN